MINFTACKCKYVSVHFKFNVVFIRFLPLEQSFCSGGRQLVRNVGLPHQGPARLNDRHKGQIIFLHLFLKTLKTIITWHKYCRGVAYTVLRKSKRCN